ncbi:serine/threonine protein kinase [Thermomonospora umbrina]|uniref:non-specific serine/threonine protein kinase n=2 Tax=Thermomonospora umbrina TaxID=111806 RepID=A0A3D9SGA7_9ACTN|nr:serine/threonine protein kinase [Thermomonospora umbrina]
MVLGGKYRLVRRLGRGGMGEVWQAEDRALGRRVAIKIVLADRDPDPKPNARLRREARTAALLQHPGITVVHDIGEHDGHPFFVMEMLDGVSFATLLAPGPGEPAGLPLARAATLTAQVCDALAYAHRKGVVHRDIKPANLMELTEGGVKICDFGISWYADSSVRLTATGGVLGTPAYMAPEQYEGEAADARTDLYSLGCTLYALLTGGPPFTGPSMVVLMRHHLLEPPPLLAASRPDAPLQLGELVARLLAKDPTHRPASATEVADTLRALISTPAPRTVPPARPVPLTPRPGNESPAPSASTLTDPQVRRKGPRRLTRTKRLAHMLTHNAEVGAVKTVAFNPAGGSLAACGDGNAVVLWDLGTHRVVREFRDQYTFRIGGLAFSPDGATLVTGAGDGVIRLWGVASGRSGAAFQGDGAGIDALAFTPDGVRLAATGGGRSVKVWDVATGRRVTALRGGGPGVSCLAFSPDGSTLAVNGRRDEIRLWDASAGAHVSALSEVMGRVRAVAFSPDGALLAAACSDSTIRLWDMSTRRCTATLSGHAGEVRSVAFGPDGALLASGGDDAYVRVWTLRDPHAIGTVGGHTGVIRSVAFGPDGSTLATGGDDGTVRLWRAP